MQTSLPSHGAVIGDTRVRLPLSRCRIQIHARLLAFVIVASPAGAQDVRPVPSCAECEIVFDSLAVVGAADGSGALRGPSVVRMDTRGRFIVVQSFSNELPAVYTADGSFHATIGRIGDGPGEYRRIQGLSTAGDMIYLYDEGTQRISAVDLDLEFQGSTPLYGAGISDALALGSDTHVVNMQVFEGSSMGYALHLVDDTGEIVRSIERFDASTADPTAHFRHLFRDADGDGFWSIPRFGRIVARQYSKNGELVRTWSSAPAPGDRLPMTYGDPAEGLAPTRQILASWHKERLVWVVSAIPDPDWRRGLTRVEDEHYGTVSYAPTNLEQVYDAAVEVFDADTGQLVVAQYPESQPVQRPISPGVAAKLKSDELGWIYLHVHRADVVRADSP